MGVHGLTTYLRENRRVLSRTVQCSSNDPNPIHVVVDAWSFIYVLHQRCSIPWVYGGEYAEFAKLVTDVVHAWISAGLRVSFVFDGPYPELKHPTLVSRAFKSIIEPSLLFFRTSQSSRTSPRFLKEAQIIPPLYYSATLYALERLCVSTSSLDVHFADEECDPYAVELAGRLGGYVIGNDSDFVVLNSDGYLGYIPLDEMVWTAVVPDQVTEVVDDDDFQQVRKPKSRSRAAKAALAFGKGVIPPENVTQISLSFSVYSPSALADHLKLPVTLLPLLGSLAGNDFTNHDLTMRQNIHAMFFERQLTLIERIDRVAATIQSILAPNSNRRKAKHQVGSVMDLIDRTVNSLMARNIHNNTASGQIDDIVDKIAEGALQYAIPKYEGQRQGEMGLWPTRICALHEPDTCPLLPSFSRLLEVAARDGSDEEDRDNDELAMRIQVRTRYLDAYRKGHIPPLVMNCLTTSTYWPRQFLESPDLETVTLLGRTIRLWGYAILDDALGLPEEQQELESPVERPDVDGDEDELVDVVESDSDMDSDAGDDLLAPLRGALQSLRGSNVSSTDQGASNPNVVPTPRPRTVNEFFRRGSKLVDEPVEVPSLADLLASISNRERNLADSAVPLVLQSQEERLSAMLRALDSDVFGITQLPPQQISVALVLRWILKVLSERAANSQNKNRESERWTRREARCFLASFSWDGSTAPQASQTPPIIDRHVQLVAQVLHVLECVDHLANILLLPDVVASPTCMFSGRAFHSYLSGSSALPDVPTTLWAVCESGLQDTFVEERKNKFKKAKSKPAQIPPVKTAKGTGLYAMLGNLET
ncbi:PIN domain-like protein [Guyanagaster necrorhizus]|uniref:PIN domain-like protein n=1 Tax=Guyanagaster necrorhizus TaxID=856835 RepID=A0A9P8AX71_9AGAR|nr:PIN domain-like protein [Guyanagaster necrorhizus MCA 3950]KAG7449632.1 PIN domain-like protein [Guyanagaster necrorhizus MCA 3950]